MNTTIEIMINNSTSLEKELIEKLNDINDLNIKVYNLEDQIVKINNSIE